MALVNPRNVSEEIPIIHITATDLSNNFLPNDQSEIPITQTVVTLDGSLRSLSGRVVNVRFDRNPTTKTFVMIIFFVNWALTIVVFHITVLTLVSRDVTVSDGVLVLPVTVILTIPALRSLFVENPSFGEPQRYSAFPSSVHWILIMYALVGIYIGQSTCGAYHQVFVVNHFSF